MTTNEIVQEALGKLDSAVGEVVLDLSPVERVDSSDLRALQGLARAAQQKSVKVTLCGARVSVYKVLKLGGW